MIKKFTSGNPIDTQAVVEKFNALPIAEFPLGGKFENGNFVFEFDMADSDIVYGLGEAPRGINKRGWVYNSFCSDDPFHTETKSSLYAAHNFLMLSGSKTFGIFIDFPSKIRWDIGYTTTNKTVITIDGTDFDIYYIDGTKPLEIVKEFRKSIGTSYVPPFGHSAISRAVGAITMPKLLTLLLTVTTRQGFRLTAYISTSTIWSVTRTLLLMMKNFRISRTMFQRKGKKESTSFRLLTQA